jgi:hypothetical protein
MRKYLVVLVFILAGCSSPGTLIQRHEPGGDIGVHDVTEAGTYGLFIDGASDPVLTYPLRAGDKLGFEMSTQPATDQLQIIWLYAVAGSDRKRLSVQQTYEWRRMPEER